MRDRKTTHDRCDGIHTVSISERQYERDDGATNRVVLVQLRHEKKVKPISKHSARSFKWATLCQTRVTFVGIFPLCLKGVNTNI